MWEQLRFVGLGAAIMIGSNLSLAQVEPAPAVASQVPAAKKGPINLELNGVGADEAFDQLGQQAGVDITVNDQQLWANADPVDLQVKDGYFWPTLLEMCNQARVRFNPHFGNGRAVLLERVHGQQQSGGKLPVSMHEGTVVRAMAANRSAAVNYENMQHFGAQFGVQLSVLWDPGVTMIGYTQVTVSEAVDELGNSLVSPQRDGGAMYGGNENSLISQAGVNLVCPANVGKKIVTLKGYVRTTTASKHEVLEIDAPLKAEPQMKETAEYTITVGPLKAVGPDNAKRYELKVAFRPKERKPGGLRRQGNDLGALINRIELRDSSGKRLQYGGGNGGGGGEVQEYTAFYHVPAGTEPAKLVWRIPTEIRELRIPFEFKDLSIPQP